MACGSGDGRTGQRPFRCGGIEVAGRSRIAR